MGVIAYTFDGVDDRVEFALGPFSGGYSAGPITMAVFYKPANTFSRPVLAFTTSGNSERLQIDSDGAAHPRFMSDSGNNVATAAVAFNTTGWWLIVATWAGSGNPRWHIHNGTSWNHASFADAATTAITSTDKLKVGTRNPLANCFAGDVVCVGIKKADSADATVETLSRTAWSAWTGYGFDWLIGFDSSQEVGGILQDQGSAGTGDETSIVGTSQVSDPAGWSWAGAVAVPKSGLLTFT